MSTILVADSGSTKTEWAVVAEGKQTDTFSTPGINPFYQNTAEIVASLEPIRGKEGLTSVQNIYFYGAGCANPEKNAIVKEALINVFQAEEVSIGSDLLGAARALCQDQPGIACILGTGSNSCFYDGQKIANQISPLGYILGDEGSGAVMGKKLIADILKNQLPPHIIQSFFDTYHLSAGGILDFVYKQPFPNRYLAQYTRFIAQYLGFPEIENIVLKSFDEFVERNLLQYPNIQTATIHFAGSVGYVFQVQLISTLKIHNLTAGQILKTPLNQLVHYHIQFQPV